MNTSPITLANEAPAEGSLNTALKNTNGRKNEEESASGADFARVLAAQTLADTSPATNPTSLDLENPLAPAAPGEWQKFAASVLMGVGATDLATPINALGELDRGLAAKVSLLPLNDHATPMDALGGLEPGLAAQVDLLPRSGPGDEGAALAADNTVLEVAGAAALLTSLQVPAAGVHGPGPRTDADLAPTSAAMDPRAIAWVATPLGHGLTIISPPEAPGVESLNTFALGQGLDPATVEWLLSGQRSAPTAAGPGAAGAMGLNNSSLAGAGPWRPLEAAIDAVPMGQGVASQTTIATLDLSQALGDEGLDWLRSMGVFKPVHLGFDATRSESLMALDGASSIGGAEGAQSVPDLQTWGTDAEGQPSTGQPHTPGAGSSSKGELATTAGTRDPQGLSGSVLSGQELAEKMSLAIGKRLLQAVERGDWQLKLQLKPAELGHIDVDLRVKGHVLEASFTAHQALTRDLLEAGSGRLKETLSQSGMDVASMKFNDGQSARFGGDSTPRHSSSGAQPRPDRVTESDTPNDGLFTASNVKPTRPGGLDLMV